MSIVCECGVPLEDHRPGWYCPSVFAYVTAARDEFRKRVTDVLDLMNVREIDMGTARTRLAHALAIEKQRVEALTS